MPRSIIGQTFTFQVLFLDAVGEPTAVNNPTIQVFRFNSSGVRLSLVAETTLPASSPPSVGRYSYPYTLPSTLSDGDTLYAEMRGEDPVSGSLLVVEQEVDVYSASSSLGLRSRFIR